MSGEEKRLKRAWENGPMCGIAGFTYAHGLGPTERRERHEKSLRQMIVALEPRGPDAQRGLLLDGIALGHTRLALLDREGGAQPMRDPTTGVTVVFNGEIFNHDELRDELVGHYAFRTRSDTEVLLASFLSRGIDCVRTFNGQFAFAIWDPRRRELWLARDRVGIVPLHYAQVVDGLAFASEAKALFAAGLVQPALDLAALKQTLVLWSPVEGRSAFEGVHQLPPRTVARFANGKLELRRYWELDLGNDRLDTRRSSADFEEELAALLDDAVRLRLSGDAPVAAYLSGGLDSTLLCALAMTHVPELRTYSVGFRAAAFDERAQQQYAARLLGTRHQCVEVDARGVAARLPDVVWRAEQPLLRAAAGPLLELSGRVRESGATVVLTGEGADELFWGYDLFKETQVRQFWARDVGSRVRPLLLGRLYPWLEGTGRTNALWREVFSRGLDTPRAPDFSHMIRWHAGARHLRLLAPDVAMATATEDPAASVLATLPPAMGSWRPLARAQLLEMRTLLSGYLLAAQGDRVLLGHGVEGRFPYLDHRLIELSARMPDRLKLAGLREKAILRRVARRVLPEYLASRPKFPYRAPVASALVGPHAPQWAQTLLSAESLASTGLFHVERVGRLVAKLERGEAVTESDAAAITAVATGQLLVERFGARVVPEPSTLAHVAVEAA